MVNKDDFAGTSAMIKLILRRDLKILPVFVIFMVILVVGIAASFLDLYPDEAIRQAFFLQMQNNPTITAFLGEVLDPSIGGLTAWRTGIPGTIVMGLISIFLMIRHTRSEERKGRLELLNSTRVGRQAALSAAFIVTYGLSILISFAIAAGLIVLGLPAESSLILGLSMGVFGSLMASVSGVAVQLTESSGDARYITVGILVGFFVLRILGWDNGNATWVSWLSPIGWVHYIRPFAGNELWVFGIFLIFIAGLTVTAYWLSSKRDLGAGIISQRPGPAHGSFRLKNSLTLAWRLHRSMLLFWIVIFALLGAMFGYTTQTVTDMINANPQFMILMSQLGGNARPGDSYFAFVLASLGEIFAVYAILATLKLRSQESKKYSEFILTSSVSRNDWAVSNLIFAVLGSAVILIVFGLVFGLSYGVNTGNLSTDLPRILAAVMAYLPAVWIFCGISMVLFGWLPRFSSLSWAALGLIVVIDLLSGFYDLNPWIKNLSPYTNVPKLLAGDTLGWPLFFVLVVAALLILIGMVGYKRRDING
jgi:ABC-2 type transport system permease protein